MTRKGPVWIQDFLNQMVVTPSGKNIKSSTFHLRGEGYHYALGINYDVSVMGAMQPPAGELYRVLW